MSDADRGAYTPPTDPPLAFDARQPVRGSRPAPVTLIVSAGVLVLLIIAIIAFYTSGVRKDGEAPATVGEPIAQMKVAPTEDEQPKDPAAGLEVYKADEPAAAPAPAAPRFTPPPEEPAPRAVAPPAPPSAAPTTPVTRAPVELPPARPPAGIDLKPAQPAPAPVQRAPARPEPAPAPAPKPAAPVAAGASGAAAVQIGAFSSQAQAEKGLADAARIAGGGKGRRIEPVQKDGSTLYRTQVTGFASRAEAVAYCDKLKAAGKSCFVK